MSDRGHGKIDYFDATWKDINLGAAQLSRPASSQPDTDEFKDSTGTDTGIETLAFDVGEKVSGSIELQHDYKEGTDIVFHTHWQGITAPDGGTDNVKWQLIYTISNNGDVLAAATTIVIESAVTTQYGFNRSDFPAIVGTAFKIGDQILFQLSRISADSDEYAGDALLATLGIHYQADTIGSKNITSK